MLARGSGRTQPAPRSGHAVVFGWERASDPGAALALAGRGTRHSAGLAAPLAVKAYGKGVAHGRDVGHPFAVVKFLGFALAAKLRAGRDRRSSAVSLADGGNRENPTVRLAAMPD